VIRAEVGGASLISWWQVRRDSRHGERSPHPTHARKQVCCRSSRMCESADQQVHHQQWRGMRCTCSPWIYCISRRTSHSLKVTDDGRCHKILAGCLVNHCFPSSLFPTPQVGATCLGLQQALAPGHQWYQDLCHTPPNTCDSQGHLTTLVLAG
jgi:hypothetical protein